MSTKKPRDRKDYASNTSKRHRLVGDILNAGIFEKMTVYQEYPVELINSSCTNGRLKLDWYIQDLNVAIEVQGEHHFNPTTYGGQTLSKAKLAFRGQVYRDAEKIQLLEEAGCALVEITPNDPLDTESLIGRITDATSNQATEDQARPQEKKKSSWRQLSPELKEERRSRQRDRYRRSRAWSRANRDRSDPSTGDGEGGSNS
jgi:hypothetical protein